MTSGSFQSVSISQITVDRDRRQRRAPSNIEELADSIRRLGLINPIVITRSNWLIAGERRLLACKSLGWTHIPAQFVDELSEHELRAIELEENIKRIDLDWQDEARAVHEYHQLRISEKPDWSVDDTANAIGLNRANVYRRLQVVAEIQSGNEMVKNAPKLSTAVGITERKAERQKGQELEAFHSIAAPRLEEEEPASAVINTNFNEWVKSYTGPKFNFIHCDFPYGIEADKFVQGAASLHGGYEDTEETYWALLNTLARYENKLCADSCHIMFWFSMHYYHETRDFLSRNTDFVIDPFPLMWLKSDNSGIIPDPQRGPRRIYETAFFGSRGDRLIVRAKSNAYAAPSARDNHMSIKPEPMLRHFFEMIVDESTIMLDPTCGSGSALRAADSLKAAHVIGLEMNPTWAQDAETALRRARMMRKVS